jgi:hypothetical protein
MAVPRTYMQQNAPLLKKSLRLRVYRSIHAVTGFTLEIRELNCVNGPIFCW